MASSVMAKPDCRNPSRLALDGESKSEIRTLITKGDPHPFFSAELCMLVPFVFRADLDLPPFRAEPVQKSERSQQIVSG